MTQPTVGEIAAGMPSAVRVFEKYQIDYCCGGHRPLGQVCQERGISAETLLAEVEQAGRRPDSGRDWAHSSLGELMAHILSTHHQYLRSGLPALSARLTRVAEAHAEKHGETLVPLASVFEGLKEEISAHLRKEEMILFPAIQELEAARATGRRARPSPFGSVENPVRMMTFEHDNAGRALVQMRRLTEGYTAPPDACATYRALYQGLEELEADLHQHIHLENNILFPRAIGLEQSR
jgi:regulator of cell morphogenesis and NO signaling